MKADDMKMLSKVIECANRFPFAAHHGSSPRPTTRARCGRIEVVTPRAIVESKAILSEIQDLILPRWQNLSGWLQFTDEVIAINRPLDAESRDALRLKTRPRQSVPLAGELYDSGEDRSWHLRFGHDQWHLAEMRRITDDVDSSDVLVEHRLHDRDFQNVALVYDVHWSDASEAMHDDGDLPMLAPLRAMFVGFRGPRDEEKERVS